MFKTILAFLGLASITFEDKKTTLTEEQFTTLETKVNEREATIAELQTNAEADAKALADAQAKATANAQTIAELQARVAELEAKPGAATATVKTEKDPQTPNTNAVVVSDENSFDQNLAAVMQVYKK